MESKNSNRSAVSMLNERFYDGKERERKTLGEFQDCDLVVQLVA